MIVLFLFSLLVAIHCPTAESWDMTEVEVHLYGQVILPCSFPFIRGPEGVTVVWEKQDKDGISLIAHKVIDGQDILADQHINYAERTELSREFSRGNVDLKIRGVTFSDEGTYFCRAANDGGHGDKEVELTINDLNAGDALVFVVHIDGKKRLKCTNDGVFRNPKVKWYNTQGEDLSEYGTQNITNLGNGRKMVESVLDLNVETNKQYICQVTEERLKRSARAVISDLNEDDVTVTVVHIDGKKRLKCTNIGVFRDPKVKWYNAQGEDLSEYGTRDISDLGDGRKKVESVLNLDVETNKHYICHVTEERLKRSARAVISDGVNSVRVVDDL